MTDICVKIYRCHLLYIWKNIDLHWCCSLLLLLLLWHICISDVTSSLVWPLPGTILQFRDNWFKNQGYFTIKQNVRMLSTQSVALYKTCKPKPRLSTHISVTRPQWVKTEKDNALPNPERFSNQIGILDIQSTRGILLFGVIFSKSLIYGGYIYVFRNREAAKMLIDFLFLLNLGFSSRHPLAAFWSI